MTALIIALAGQALAGIAPHAAIEAPSSRLFRTEAGLEIRLPEIAGLTCAERESLLARIDRTNYRAEGIPEPADPDFALFQYEDSLSRAIFHDCILDAHGGVSSTVIFTDGFEGR